MLPMILPIVILAPAGLARRGPGTVGSVLALTIATTGGGGLIHGRNRGGSGAGRGNSFGATALLGLGGWKVIRGVSQVGFGSIAFRRSVHRNEAAWGGAGPAGTTSALFTVCHRDQIGHERDAVCAPDP
jgi:hypothetical protein